MEGQHPTFQKNCQEISGSRGLTTGTRDDLRSCEEEGGHGEFGKYGGGMEVRGGCEQEEEELIGANLDSLVGSNIPSDSEEGGSFQAVAYSGVLSLKDVWPEDQQEGKFI